MPQDAFTLNYLSKELNSILKDGKVNRIIEPNNDEIVLTIYTGIKTERLFISVNPSCPRIGLIYTEKDSPLTAPNFCMLLRKHLQNATLNNIELIGFDRILRIDFTASNEFFDGLTKIMYVELMGRYSNIILTENGKILGGNRGINMFDDGVRPLIVGTPYVFPPTNNKKIPNDIALLEILKNCSENDIANFLCANVQGIALSTAEQLLYEYKIKYNIEYVNDDIKVNYKRFFEFLNNFLYLHEVSPVVYTKDNSVVDVCICLYNNLNYNYIKFNSLHEAEDYFFEQKEIAKKFHDRQERLKNILQSQIKKSKKKLSSILAKEKDTEDIEENRIKGELIISNIYKLKYGDKECELENYYDDNNLVKIALDDHLSPQQNAEKYFKKYNKQKRTLTAIVPQKEQAQRELDYLESVLDEINISNNSDDIELIYREMEESGLIEIRKNTKKKQDNAECRTYIIDGFVVKVGRNNIENDRVTFSARQESMWLHAKNYHSSHAIIEYNGNVYNKNVIEKVAEIVAYYSSGRNAGKVEIVYTLKKFVKKPPKSKIGFVVYTEYKSIMSKIDSHNEFLKK